MRKLQALKKFRLTVIIITQPRSKLSQPPFMESKVSKTKQLI